MTMHPSLPIVQPLPLPLNLMVIAHWRPFDESPRSRYWPAPDPCRSYADAIINRHGDVAAEPTDVLIDQLGMSRVLSWTARPAQARRWLPARRAAILAELARRGETGRAA